MSRGGLGEPPPQGKAGCQEVGAGAQTLGLGSGARPRLSPGGEQHQGLASGMGMVTAQVNGFKLKNNKNNTKKKKKRQPLSQTSWRHRPAPHKGQGSRVEGPGPGPGRGGFQARLSVCPACPPVAHLHVAARRTGLALRFIALFWKRPGAEGATQGVGSMGRVVWRRHRLVLASSRIFQITRCMQALASSLELCPSTLSWMICLR